MSTCAEDTTPDETSGTPEEGATPSSDSRDLRDLLRELDEAAIALTRQVDDVLNGYISCGAEWALDCWQVRRPAEDEDGIVGYDGAISDIRKGVQKARGLVAPLLTFIQKAGLDLHRIPAEMPRTAALPPSEQPLPPPCVVRGLEDPGSPLTADQYRALCARLSVFNTGRALQAFSEGLDMMPYYGKLLAHAWEYGRLEEEGCIDDEISLSVVHNEAWTTLAEMEATLPEVAHLLAEARVVLESLPSALPPLDDAGRQAAAERRAERAQRYAKLAPSPTKPPEPPPTPQPFTADELRRLLKDADAMSEQHAWAFSSLFHDLADLSVGALWDWEDGNEAEAGRVLERLREAADEGWRQMALLLTPLCSLTEALKKRPLSPLPPVDAEGLRQRALREEDGENLSAPAEMGIVAVEDPESVISAADFRRTMQEVAHSVRGDDLEALRDAIDLVTGSASFILGIWEGDPDFGSSDMTPVENINGILREGYQGTNAAITRLSAAMDAMRQARYLFNSLPATIPPCPEAERHPPRQPRRAREVELAPAPTLKPSPEPVEVVPATTRASSPPIVPADPAAESVRLAIRLASAIQQDPSCAVHLERVLSAFDGKPVLLDERSEAA